MAWAKIDDQYFFHPKVIAAGRDARDLHLASMVYCSGQLTNGSVTSETLPLLGAMAGIPNPGASAKRLVEVGLWEEADGGGWLLHDYLEYNPSADEVRATRKARIEAGRKGGLQTAQQTASKPPSKREAKPPANAEASAQANEKQSEKQNSTPSPSPSASPVPDLKEVAATTPPPNPPKRRRKRKPDPRTQHPAIQAVREVTNRYPPKPIWDDIIKLLGDDPRMEEMRLCFKEWVKPGYNPTNFAWLFDWYVSGIPVRRPTRGSIQEDTADVIKRYRERHSGDT